MITSPHRRVAIGLVALLLLLPTAIVSGQSQWVWQANIHDEDLKPIPFANVLVPDQNLGGVSDEMGDVEIIFPQSGEYEVLVSVIGYEELTLSITVPSKTHIRDHVVLRETVLEGGTVTVTLTGLPTDILNSERTISVLEGEALTQKMGQSMSETLSDVPGLQLQSQGHAVAKPVIRGMSNQRLVILKDGVRQEGQQWGGHHTPEADILGLGRIEVLRGPLGLVHGSDALGGVIHLVSPKMRTLEDHGQPLKAAARLGFHANSKQSVGSFGLQRSWQHTALRLSVSGRNSGNYSVPGGTDFLVEQDGTAYQQINGSFHFLNKLHEGEIEVLGGHYWEEQTLIGDGHWHATGGGPDGNDPWFHVLSDVVSPTLHQNLTFKGRRYLRGGWLEYSAGSQRNHRQGGPADEDPVVDLTTTTHSADLKYRHTLLKEDSGTLGLSMSTKSSESIGSERLLPDYVKRSAGLFYYFALKRGELKYTGGLRMDGQIYDLEGSDFSALALPEDERRQYFPVPSASLGMVWHPEGKDYSWATNIGTGWRPPNPYELYINGVHHGDWKIEIGDADLKPETSVNADVILRHATHGHTGELAFFFNRLQNYITSDPTGQFDDNTGIPIYHINQTDAVILGNEMRLTYDLTDHLTGDIGWDVTWSQRSGEGVDVDGDGKVETALSGINPPRILTGISWEFPRSILFIGEGETGIGLELERVFAQTNLAEYENIVDDGYGNPVYVEPKPYTIISLTLSSKTHVGHIPVNLLLGVNNLLNEKYCSHLSKYKGIAYDQGLDVHFQVGFQF